MVSRDGKLLLLRSGAVSREAMSFWSCEGECERAGCTVAGAPLDTLAFVDVGVDMRNTLPHAGQRPRLPANSSRTLSFLLQAQVI